MKFVNLLLFDSAQSVIFVLTLHYFVSTTSSSANVTENSKDDAAKLPEKLFEGWVNPTPITVNPHLEELDEKFSKCEGIDIREISVLDIQKYYSTNQLTAVKLTKCYLERLDRLNEVLRVVVEVNPDVLQDAIKSDEERANGKIRGRMHGIPVLLKDAIGTVDRTETTVGSPALVGIRPKREADVVTTLRKAGALIMGKSHCQEFYGFRGTNIPFGWSGRGGQTRNAYNINVSPDGSSSGSGVGVAANLVPVAIGSETDGSIIAPSNLNGVVGLKSTLGLVSTRGTIPISHNHDHLGPMTRTVMDAAILLDAMVAETDRPAHHPASYAQHLLENATTRPFRVGVLRFPFWDASVINSTNLLYQLPRLEQMLQTMKNSPSFEVIDPVEAPSYQNVSIAFFYLVLYHDFKHNIQEYLQNDVENQYPKTRPPSPFPQAPNAYMSVIAPKKNITCLQDIINYVEEHPSTHGYYHNHFNVALATDGVKNETYIEVRDTNLEATKTYLNNLFQQYNLDAVVVPSESRNEWRQTTKTLKSFPTTAFSLACITGFPSINIPAGIGLRETPFGAMFIAKPYHEPTLLQIAHATEQIYPQRRRPRFLI